jgi:hypothetical protein
MTKYIIQIEKCQEQDTEDTIKKYLGVSSRKETDVIYHQVFDNLSTVPKVITAVIESFIPKSEKG